MLKTAYNNDALGKNRMYFKWFLLFLKRRDDDRRQTEQKYCSNSCTSDRKPVWNLLELGSRNLNRRFIAMARVAVKFMSQIQKYHQIEWRVETCWALKSHQRIDPIFISKVITRNEAWCYGYDPETNQQGPTNKLYCRHAPKMHMLICFFDVRGV